MANDIDRLFAMEAIIKTATAERDILKAECAEKLLEDYEKDGTTQRRSTYFGKGAGTFSVTTSKPKPSEEVVEYNLADWEEFAGWCDENPRACAMFALANGAEFGRWWLESEGELPDGISRVSYMTDAVPERVTGTRLSVKQDVIMDALQLNLAEGMQQLLEGGEDA